MRFDELLSLVRELPWFDIATLVQLADTRRSSLLAQLARFAKAEKIIPLRRGMYVLGEVYRQVPVLPHHLANAIYKPSYLSELWALSYYGAILEKVSEITSVTTRTPKRFVNAFGEFSYRHVKASFFFGYAPVSIAGRKVLIASPEKALVDLLYLQPGEWTEARLRALRLDVEAFDAAHLTQVVERFDKPRLRRALERWLHLGANLVEGEVTL